MSRRTGDDREDPDEHGRARPGAGVLLGVIGALGRGRQLQNGCGRVGRVGRVWTRGRRERRICTIGHHASDRNRTPSRSGSSHRPCRTLRLVAVLAGRAGAENSGAPGTWRGSRGSDDWIVRACTIRSSRTRPPVHPCRASSPLLSRRRRTRSTRRSLRPAGSLLPRARARTRARPPHRSPRRAR